MAQPEILIRAVDLPANTPFPGSAVRQVNGDEHSLGGFSLIVGAYPVGADTPPHRHPHISAIVVAEGHGQFTVGDRTVAAGVGDIVVVPANAWHSFRNDGDGPLRVVGSHDSGHHAAELQS
jgi:quercetin dioxygenase-like cupin family protein